MHNEVEVADGTGDFFPSTDNKAYTHLTAEDTAVLDKIIYEFGTISKTDIVRAMHKEKAFINTVQNEIISYNYASQLSIA